MTKSLDQEMEEMRGWFYANYEDPVHRCPYDGREGGYQFVFGGPYDPEEVLIEEFGGKYTENAITELAKELAAECWQWSGKDDGGNDEFYDVVEDPGTIPQQYATFLSSVSKCRAAVSIIPLGEESFYLKLLYAHGITILETFLSEYLISKTTPDSICLRNFVSNYPEFSKEKIPLSQLYHQHENIHNYARQCLTNVLWHNIPKVKKIYEVSFGTKITRDTKKLADAVVLRHDLIHRNGKNRQGHEVTVSHEDVRILLDEIEGFAKEIIRIAVPNSLGVSQRKPNPDLF